MKFSCFQSNLNDCLQIIQGVISPRSTLPILSNLLMEVKGNTIYLTGTDLEIGIRCQLPCKMESKGIITISARKFAEIIKELPSQDIQISLESNNYLSISCGKSYFKIVGMPGDDFPKFNLLKEETPISITAEVLKEIFKKTSYAVSYDETRYMLNGVLLVVSDDKISAVATDGRRLAYITNILPSPGGNYQVIIPTKAINQLNRILDKDGEVKVRISPKTINFEFKDIILTSRLIEGKFPDYEQVIPKKFKARAIVNRDNFLNAVKRASLLTSEKSSSIKMEISPKKSMIISARDPELGEAKEEIGISYEGEALTIAFDPTFILDVLKNIDAQEVSLELIEPLSPGVFRPVSDEAYICVIMPMKV